MPTSKTKTATVWTRPLGLVRWRRRYHGPVDSCFTLARRIADCDRLVAVHVSAGTGRPPKKRVAKQRERRGIAEVFRIRPTPDCTSPIQKSDPARNFPPSYRSMAQPTRRNRLDVATKLNR